MSNLTYRVVCKKRLSKNIYYHICISTYPLISKDEAIRYANKFADDMVEVNKDYDVIRINVGAVGSSSDNNFVSHTKVINSSRNEDIADIFVYPIEQHGSDLNSIYRYRGLDIKCNETDGCLDIYGSCFKFGSTVSLDGALMFVDSFLFACDLQQRDNG